jgi:hypothetical protein
MKARDTTVDSQYEGQSLWRRLIWLVAIWAASVAAVGLTAELLRLLMGLAGLRTH